MRELKLVFDEFSVGVQETLLVVKPDAFEQKDEILQAARDAKFTIVRHQVLQLRPAHVAALYPQYINEPFFPAIRDYMNSGASFAVVLAKHDGIRACRVLCGPTDPRDARQVDPRSLRARFGLDDVRNAVHCSQDLFQAEKEINLAFKVFSQSVVETFVWIKPDAVDKAEEIKQKIINEGGFELVEEQNVMLSSKQVCARTCVLVPFFYTVM